MRLFSLLAQSVFVLACVTTTIAANITATTNTTTTATTNITTTTTSTTSTTNTTTSTTLTTTTTNTSTTSTTSTSTTNTTTTTNTSTTSTTSTTNTTTTTTTSTTSTSTTTTSTTTTSTTTTSTTTTTELAPRVLWASRAGGAGNDWGTFLTFDVDNNLFITGECGMSAIQSLPASFGSTKLPCTIGDMFLMCVDGSGYVEYATHQPKKKSASFHRRVVDSAGNVYETGRQTQAWTSKHSGEGMLEWRRHWGGTGDEGGNAVTVDSSGNVFVVGHFSSTLQVGTTHLTSIGSCATFINKLSPTGDVVWSVRVESASGGKVAGYGIAVDDMSNVLVTGAFEGTMMYGAATIKSAGGQDIFVMKLDSWGNILWALSAGGEGQDSGNAIAVDRFGDLFVTGSFSGRASFGDVGLESQGDLDVFWMKLSGK